MTRSNHTRRQLAKATAALAATAALLVPGALASSGASNSNYDPWFNNAIAVQRSQPDPWFNNALANHRSLAGRSNDAQQTGYRFITDTLGGAGRPVSGYQFITDTLAPGGSGGGNDVAVADPGFSWADAGVGASSMLGLALLILTGRTVALRRRGRLAF
jgi:hypothetical protein